MTGVGGSIALLASNPVLWGAITGGAIGLSRLLESQRALDLLVAASRAGSREAVMRVAAQLERALARSASTAAVQSQ